MLPGLILLLVITPHTYDWPSTDGGDVVRDQASPLVGAVVDRVAVVVRLSGADGIAELPESISSHARRRRRGDLPGSLQLAVPFGRAVCVSLVVSYIASPPRPAASARGGGGVPVYSHSSKKQGLFAAAQWTAWSVTHLLPAEYPTPPASSRQPLLPIDFRVPGEGVSPTLT